MKKKFFTVFLCCMTVWSGISAQESVSAFKNLAVGLEFLSTTGLGLELATPLSPNFALRGGISILPFSYHTTPESSVDQSILEKIDNAINTYPNIVSDLNRKGLPTRAADISSDINATASLNLINGKILFDYYPWAKYSFHFTGGLYIGASEILKVKGRMDEAVDVLNVLKDNGVDYFNEPYLLDKEKDYQLTGKDVMDIRGQLKTNSVKPYFGLGFGRAVPKSRVSVSFELGAFYHGTPKITSESQNIQKLIDNELSDVSEILKDIPIYPVISLKLNIKLF